MSRHLAFRRQPVDQQVAQALRLITFPAPTRGIVESENEAYMQPGGAIIQENWATTMRGIKLRGGCVRHCDLHALDTVVPPVPSASRLPVISAFEYQDSDGAERMFAAQQTKLFDVTGPVPVLVKAGQTSGNYAAAQLANAAIDPLGTNWLLAVNDSGDPILRFNGTDWGVLDPTGAPAWANSTAYTVGALVFDVDGMVWKTLVAHTSAAVGTTFAADRVAHPTYWTSNAGADGASFISGPVGSPVEHGRNLVYIWKYRNRLFFIQANSMNAWYLGINSVGGVLAPIPLAGAATKGGKLLWGATWSLDAGDGIDEKCIFGTDQGEVLIFTGTNPSDSANWRQEGRYRISKPMGMNAHMQVGGDMLLLTVDGIIPLSQAITKEAGQLELAMLTRTIKRTWREEVVAKGAFPWTATKWDEYGSLFVATPGGPPGQRRCLVANNATAAWSRFIGYDATCWIRMYDALYFGNQDGIVMQADRTGYDDGVPYVATLVGGWEAFGAPGGQVVWHQARASFHSGGAEPFIPQLAATTDYIVTLPQPPPAGPDPGVLDVWDQGIWPPATPAYDPPPFPAPPADVAAYAQWDQPGMMTAPVRNTLWVSIGQTGHAHAPIVQVTVAQQGLPNVELLAISATYEPAGVNV